MSQDDRSPEEPQRGAQTGADALRLEPLAKAPKQPGRGPMVWTSVIAVSPDTVGCLGGTPFRPDRYQNGVDEVRTPDGRGFPLLRIGPESNASRVLYVPAPRRARRSEHGAEEMAYSYLRLGLAKLPEAVDQPRELLRLLKNVAAHVSGADLGRPHLELREMRGPEVRGGLPSLGKRRR